MKVRHVRNWHIIGKKTLVTPVLCAMALLTAVGLSACSSTGSQGTHDSAGSTIANSTGASPASNLTTVTFGSLGGLSDGPMYVAQALGFFHDEGITFKHVRRPNAAAIGTALASGQIDTAALSASPALFTSIAKGFGLQIVADYQSNQGAGGFGPAFIALDSVVRGSDSPAALGKALRGRNIAISGKGSSSEVMLVGVLKTYGLTESDVHVVQLPFPDMAAAFETHKIDAALMIEPFTTKVLGQTKAKKISEFAGVVPMNGTVVPLLFSKEFASNKSLAERFTQGYLLGAAYIRNALTGDKDHYNQVISILAKSAQIPESLVEKVTPNGVNPCRPPDLSWMKNSAEHFYLSQNLLTEHVNVSKAYNPYYVQTALSSNKKLITLCKSLKLL